MIFHPATLTLALVALISSALLCNTILAGNQSSSQPEHQAYTNSDKFSESSNDFNNLTVANNSLSTSQLDANSTFYYEADAFLLNKHKVESGDLAPGAVNQRAISGRNGRMLDLDALVGDLAASKANREARAQLTSRQSRNLMAGGDMLKAPTGAGHQLDIGGGKRLHIQGFIPIVGIKEDASEEDEQQHQVQPHITQQMANSNRQRPKMMMMSSSGQMNPALSPQNDPPPYGQSSMGHATFNVQRYLNTDQTTGESNSHQFVPLPQMHSQLLQSLNQQQQQQQQQQLVGAKFGNSNSAAPGGGIVGALKKPLRKLSNSFGAGAQNSDSVHAKQQLQSTQTQNCLCVPFYMCKGGQLSESGLGRAQIQQIIIQQHQQQQLASQQPRQLTAGPGEQVRGNLAVPTGPATVESVVAQDSGASYANSMVPVDERSFERDVITAAPVALELILADGVQNQTMSQQQLEQQMAATAATATTTTTTATATATAKTEEAQQADALGVSVNGLSSPMANHEEMTTLNQANDYSQDILGRMLGLKSVASQQQASERQQPGGVCGLLRTCCAVPSQLLPYGPHYQQQQQQQQLIQQQDQLMQQHQVALQLYQQPQSNSAAATIQAPQQISRMQTAAPPTVSTLQQLAALPSSLIHRTSSMSPAPALPRPVNSPQVSLQQYSRASYPQQPLHSFQQQAAAAAAAARQQALQQPVVVAAVPSPQVARSQQPGAPQLGTRKLLEGRCGLRHSTGINGRVQNLAYQENAAEFGEYPAQAAILKRLNGSESLFVCGGTLISQSWVATAAHCIRKHIQAGEHLKVRLGEWDVHRDDEFYPFVEKEVRDLVVHPEFVPGNLINDLALLRLDSPVDPTLPHVNPACLPTIDESFARQRCWVTGWGKDSFGIKGSFQAVLQEVELPVEAHAECELQLRQTRLGPHYRLHPGFICAGGEGGKDACEGDGGSGLYCAQEGVIKVAGLVSWGIGCGQAGVPGVYVNMAHYRPWIENIIAIDEDIYSSYTQFPVNTLISERSVAPPSGARPMGNAPPAENSTTSAKGQQLDEQARNADKDSATATS